MRNRGFDRDVRHAIRPQRRSRAQGPGEARVPPVRLAAAFENAAIELLSALAAPGSRRHASQRIGVERGNLRSRIRAPACARSANRYGPNSSCSSRAISCAPDPAAKPYVRRDAAFPPRRLPRVAARWFNLVQIAASSGARQARRAPHSALPRYRSWLRKRPERCQRTPTPSS